MTLKQNLQNWRRTLSLSFMYQGDNSCCIWSWLVEQGPSCQATIQWCMGPSWQTAANEAGAAGRGSVLELRAVRPPFSWLTCPATLRCMYVHAPCLTHTYTHTPLYTCMCTHTNYLPFCVWTIHPRGPQAAAVMQSCPMQPPLRIPSPSSSSSPSD